LIYAFGRCNGGQGAMLVWAHPFDSSIALNAVKAFDNGFGFSGVTNSSDFAVIPHPNGTPTGDMTKRDFFIYDPGATHGGDPTPKINLAVGLNSAKTGPNATVFKSCGFTNSIPAGLTSQDQFYRNYIWDSVMGQIIIPTGTGSVYSIVPTSTCTSGSPTWAWGTIAENATDYSGASCTSNTNCPNATNGGAAGEGSNTYPASGYLRADDAYEMCWFFNCWIYKK